MDLTVLKPKPSKFFLRKVNRYFTMNEITLSDEIWLSQEFGNDLGKIFQEINMPQICRIAFRLLDIEDKKFFKKQIVEIVSEDGDISEKEMGGIDLFNSLISGWEEKNDIVGALLENIGLSRPESDESDDKKKEKI